MILESLTEVLREMRRQVSLYGVQHLPHGTGGPGTEEALTWARDTFERARKNGHLTWVDVLNEEVKEVYAECDPTKVREELIQVAAVCLSWVRDIDGL